MKLNGKVYDVLKWVAILLLPALGKLILGVFGTWGIPYGPQIADTLRDVQVFLGAILAIDSIRYKSAQNKAIEEGESDA